jgi:hypothetical protein
MKDLESIKLEKLYESILKEAPIDSFNLIGDWEKDSKPRGYDKASRGILTSEAGVKKIKKLWNKTEENFDIYMVSTKHGWKYTEVGEVDEDFIVNNLKIKVPINRDHITIFYTNNKGSEKVPTTAWTLAHRFGHALRRKKGYSKNDAYDQIFNTINNLVENISENIYNVSTKNNFGDYEKRYKNDKIKKQIVLGLGTFRSAREKILRDYYEFTNEIIAQYIIQGKITFNKKLPSILALKYNWGNPSGPSKKYNSELEYNIESTIESIENDLNSYYLPDLLNSAVGKIYVM